MRPKIDTEFSYIYTLIDPFTNEIRYIGKTIDPLYRYWTHFRDQELSYDTYKNRWLKKLMKKNQLPFMNIIAKCKFKNSNKMERHYITFYKNKGIKLTNTTKGGDGWPAGTPMIGKHQKGNYQIHQFKKVKAINKFNNKEILYFDGVKIAAKKLNISKENISDCLRKLIKSIGGYHWFYANEKIKIPTYYKPKLVQGKHVQTGKIIIFKSTYDVKGFCQSSVAKACNGNQDGKDGHYHKGYNWRRV